MYMKNPQREDQGWWLVRHPSFAKSFLVELKFETWDHTRDGDRWVIYHEEDEIEQHQKEWWNYDFIAKQHSKRDFENLQKVFANRH